MRKHIYPKILLLLSATFALAASGNAAPETVRENTEIEGIVNSDFPSVYGLKLREAVKKAEAENKVVLVTINAAWCDACEQDRILGDKIKDEMADTYDQAVVVNVEQMNNARVLLSDFMPTGHLYYSTKMLYHPVFKKWSRFPAATRFLKTALPYFKAHGELGSLMLQQFAVDRNIPNRLSYDKYNDGVGFYHHAIVVLLMEGRIKEALTMAKDLNNKPAAGFNTTYSTPENGADIATGITAGLILGTLTEDKLKEDMPNFQDLVSGGSPYLMYNYEVRVKLARLARLQGTKSVAAMCTQYIKDVYNTKPPRLEVPSNNASDAEREEIEERNQATLVVVSKLRKEALMECESLRADHDLAPSEYLSEWIQAADALQIQYESNSLPNAYRPMSEVSRLAQVLATYGEWGAAKLWVTRGRLMTLQIQTRYQSSDYYKTIYEDGEKMLQSATTPAEKELAEIMIRNGHLGEEAVVRCGVDTLAGFDNFTHAFNEWRVHVDQVE